MPSVQADATIASLCERLDRLPLAIELAAARISAMTPAEILADLEPRLGALGGGGRLSPSRHRTVRATVGGATNSSIETRKRHSGPWPFSSAASTPRPRRRSPPG